MANRLMGRQLCPRKVAEMILLGIFLWALFEGHPWVALLIDYTFEDDGLQVDQVWHYELHDGTWKLNGIETI